MNKKIRQADMGGLLVLLLFGIFAVCILSVLFAGIRNYRKLIDRDTESFNRRTSLQYMATKIREADAEDRVYIGSFDDLAENSQAEEGDTLYILEEHEGVEYATRIYPYKGYIREIFTDRESELDRDAGEKILKAEDMHFQKQGQKLTIQITDENGNSSELTLSVRSHLSDQKGGAE